MLADGGVRISDCRTQLESPVPPTRALHKKVGNGHAARSEICNRRSSGTQRRLQYPPQALADCTWMLDIGDRRMRIGDVQKPASDFLCKAPSCSRRGLKVIGRKDSEIWPDSSLIVRSSRL